MDAVEPYAEECRCAETVWVFRVIKGGTKQYGTQCLRCGKFTVTKKTAVPCQATLGEYDESLRDYFLERRRRFYERRAEQNRAEWEARKEAESQEWWSRYEAYISSDAWREKRLRVLERDKWTCQACMRRRATQVHHLTYKHLEHEPLFDLVSICTVCHEALTEIDRCNR